MFSKTEVLVNWSLKVDYNENLLSNFQSVPSFFMVRRVIIKLVHCTLYDISDVSLSAVAVINLYRVFGSKRFMPIKNCRGLSKTHLCSSPSCELNFCWIYKPIFSSVHRQPGCQSYVIKLGRWCPKKIVILRLKMRFFWVLKMIIF